MAVLKIAQIRYYDDNNALNSLGFQLYTTFCGDTAFTKFSPIRHLGVQTLPGTRMYLNRSTTPIIIGATGIYELDIKENSTALLSSIRFDETSMKTIRDLENGFLLSDLVYEGSGNAS